MTLGIFLPAGLVDHNPRVVFYRRRNPSSSTQAPLERGTRLIFEEESEETQSAKGRPDWGIRSRGMRPNPPLEKLSREVKAKLGSSCV